jgi:hypothetical protein
MTKKGINLESALSLTQKLNKIASHCGDWVAIKYPAHHNCWQVATTNDKFYFEHETICMKNKTGHTELTKRERINRRTAIITSTKIEKLVSYGFRFEKIDLAKIGRVITNHDGSRSTIEAVASAL